MSCWSCRDIKLHATVLNTRHRWQTHGNQGNNTQGARAGEGPQQQQQRQHYQERTPFDGRWLLANFGDLDLGVQNISQIHLSQRGKYADDGYYHAIDTMSL